MAVELIFQEFLWMGTFYFQFTSYNRNYSNISRKIIYIALIMHITRFTSLILFETSENPDLVNRTPPKKSKLGLRDVSKSIISVPN